MKRKRWARERRACWHCSADFLATLPDMVFCSGECGREWRGARAPTAPELPAPVLDKQGYVKIGGRYEHRMVAEKFLGRHLRRGEDVHHLNGIRHDNRPENLSVVSHRDHAALHHAERAAARSGDQVATGEYQRPSRAWRRFSPSQAKPLTEQRVAR